MATYYNPSQWDLEQDLKNLHKLFEENMTKMTQSNSSDSMAIVTYPPSDQVSASSSLAAGSNLASAGAMAVAEEHLPKIDIEEIEMKRLKNTRLGKCGLINQGNTCYFNSIVQCLMACPEFFAELDSIPIYPKLVQEIIAKGTINLEGDTILDYDKGQLIEHDDYEFNDIVMQLNTIEHKKDMDAKLTIEEDKFYNRFEKISVMQKNKLRILIKNCTEIAKNKKKEVLKLKDDDEPEITNEEAFNSVMKSVTNILRRTYRAVWSKNAKIKPQSLFKKLGEIDRNFDNHFQQDSHEALQKILERTHEEMSEGCNVIPKYSDPKLLSFVESIKEINKILNAKKGDYSVEEVARATEKLALARKKETSLSVVAESIVSFENFYNKTHSYVTRYTQMFTQTTRKCLVCGSLTSVSTEPNIMLSIPIPTTKHNSTLEECLDMHFKSEKLTFINKENDNRIKCVHCGILTDHEVSSKLWNMPKILMIQLKRFETRSIGANVFVQKQDKEIIFPIKELDLKDYICKDYPVDIGSTKYDLFAMSNHSGSYSGGHYVAFSKHIETDDDGKDMWYFFDDSSKPVYFPEKDDKTMNDIFNSRYNPYILFYVKRSSESFDEDTDDEEGEETIYH